MTRERQGLGYLTEGGVRLVAESYLMKRVEQKDIDAVLAPATAPKGRRKAPDQVTALLQEIYWFVYYNTDTSTTVIGKALNRSRAAVSEGARRCDVNLSPRLAYSRKIEREMMTYLGECRDKGLMKSRIKKR